MDNYSPSKLSKIRRGAKNATYDKTAVHTILDAHFMCHIPYVFEDSYGLCTSRRNHLFAWRNGY